MSAGFWLMICIGRVLWAAISSAITSGFPPLAFDGILMLLSSMLIAQFGRSKRHGRHLLLAIEPASLLWCGTLGLGFGRLAFQALSSDPGVNGGADGLQC